MDLDVERVNQKVDEVAHKLDALSASVDRRFDIVDGRFDDVDKRFSDVDKRFDEVSGNFVEQRQYTEFAFERLRGETLAGFARMESRFDRLEQQLALFIETQGGINRKFSRQIAALRRRRPKS